MKINKPTKIALSLMLIVLVVLRWIDYETASTRLDTISLALIIAAILIYVIPWENIKTFKAAGFELTLEQSQVKSAIDGLGLDHVKNKVLLEQLSHLDAELQSIRGGKVLWIDDKPHPLIGVRRLLRALSIQIVSATSSTMASDILESDNDFDLIITDVQRKGESSALNGDYSILDGVDFILKLRKHQNSTIRALPVVFYAAYDWERLVRLTRPAREIQPEPDISNSVNDFIPKVVKRLAIARAQPISYSEEKEPTSVR
jgi:CheY-like chemotaxis protein